MSDQSCGNCFFRRSTTTATYCHRNPPPWERVAVDAWCGEWRENAAVELARIERLARAIMGSRHCG